MDKIAEKIGAAYRAGIPPHHIFGSQKFDFDKEFRNYHGYRTNLLLECSSVPISYLAPLMSEEFKDKIFSEIILGVFQENSFKNGAFKKFLDDVGTNRCFSPEVLHEGLLSFLQYITGGDVQNPQIEETLKAFAKCSPYESMEDMLDGFFTETYCSRQYSYVERVNSFKRVLQEGSPFIESLTRCINSLGGQPFEMLSEEVTKSLCKKTAYVEMEGFEGVKNLAFAMRDARIFKGDVATELVSNLIKKKDLQPAFAKRLWEAADAFGISQEMNDLKKFVCGVGPLPNFMSNLLGGGHASATFDDLLLLSKKLESLTRSDRYDLGEVVKDVFPVSNFLKILREGLVGESYSPQQDLLSKKYCREIIGVLEEHKKSVSPKKQKSVDWLLASLEGDLILVECEESPNQSKPRIVKI